MARARLAGDRPAPSRVAARAVMLAIRRRGGRRACRRLAHDWRWSRTGRAAAVGLEQSKPRQALDRSQEIALFVIAKRDRLSRFARSRGAADAMNIGFGDLRQFKIDDMTDAVDVDAARRDVGRNERARFSGAEGGQRALALALALIAMNDGSVDARLIECAADAIGAVLGAGEDEDAGELEIVEQLDQEVALLRRFDKKDVVLDAVGGLGRRASPRPRRDRAAIRRRARECRWALSPRRTGSVASWAIPERSGGSA